MNNPSQSSSQGAFCGSVLSVLRFSALNGPQSKGTICWCLGVHVTLDSTLSTNNSGEASLAY